MRMHVYGPVPSRRLGRSLGINNIPPKACSYSCVYCQVGRTLYPRIHRREFYRPEEIVDEVAGKVGKIREKGDSVDYLTFVPDGEPTLDVNLGLTIDLLKPFGIKIAVITNGSLLYLQDVREELARADLVSIKVDSVEEGVWRRVNRPSRSLRLSVILDGMLEFAGSFKGELITETMLISDINDKDDDIEQVAGFLSLLKPETAFISIPTRPPAEDWVVPPDEERVNLAFQIFSERIARVECLIEYEGDSFSCTGDPERDLLSITSVHPMREDALKKFLADAGCEWGMIRRLIDAGSLVETEYRGKKFFLRRFGRTGSRH
jgi:wyosine [tRNA(Phe)-imidazoG37] synthetase (radical SAM superfamily)